MSLRSRIAGEAICRILRKIKRLLRHSVPTNDILHFVTARNEVVSLLEPRLLHSRTRSQWL